MSDLAREGEQRENLTCEAEDMFGSPFSKGDLFLYCPGLNGTSELRVGIFMGVVSQDLKEPRVEAIFVNPIRKSCYTSREKLEFFKKRSSIIHNRYFLLDSPLIRKALKCLEVLREAGEIPSDS